MFKCSCLVEAVAAVGGLSTLLELSALAGEAAQAVAFLKHSSMQTI